MKEEERREVEGKKKEGRTKGRKGRERQRKRRMAPLFKFLNMPLPQTTISRVKQIYTHTTEQLLVVTE